MNWNGGLGRDTASYTASKSREGPLSPDGAIQEQLTHSLARLSVEPPPSIGLGQQDPEPG